MADHSKYEDRDPSELYLEPPPLSEATKRARNAARMRASSDARVKAENKPHPYPPQGQRPLANDPIHGGSAGPVESSEEGS